MLKLKRKKQVQSVIKWADAKIPASVFFEILETGNLSLLGTAPKEELEKAFDGIFDLYVTLENNQKVIQWYKKQVKISLITNQITLIETLIYIITFTPLSKDERLKFIEKLNGIDGVRVNFKADKPIIDEISRVKNVVLGILQNRLNLELSTEKKQKEDIKYSYMADISSMEAVLGYNLPEDMSLEMFIHRKKIAKEKSKPRPKASRHGK